MHDALLPLENKLRPSQSGVNELDVCVDTCQQAQIMYTPFGQIWEPT
jgi:hypothetical protein